MAGNEKSVVIFGLQNSTIRSGYPLTPGDKFILSTQLMNLEDKEKWVWITITYDYVDTDPAKYKDGRNMWMSLSPMTAGACPSTMTNPFGESNLTSSLQPKKNVFSEHSLPWIAPSDGFILATGGHMHDGGTSTDIYLNDKVICTSTPQYGKGEGHHGGMEGMGPTEGGGASNNADIPHIQSQNRCEFADGMPLKKGDKMYISANYDFTKRQGMRNQKDELDSVMGIVGTLVAS